MTNVKINFDQARALGGKINEAASDASTLLSAANGIDPGQVSSFSSSTVANTEAINTSISQLSQSMDNMEMSYAKSLQVYVDAYERTKEYVENISGEEDTSYTPEVIDEKVGFYFGYPEGTQDLVAVSKEALIACFEKNGAKDLGKGLYEFEINGNTFQYNVNTEEIKLLKTSGVTSSYGDKETVKCKFYSTSENPNFDDITNTVTYCCGSQGNPKQIKAEDLKINDNTMVAVVYGYNSGDIPGKVAASTYAADFLAGGNKKQMSNNIVGYSLGGIAAFRTASVNPGLYKKLVCVNSYNRFAKPNDLQNLKDMEIVFVENASDKFTKENLNTIKSLIDNGVPAENISIITNSGGGKNDLGNANSYLYKVGRLFYDQNSMPTDVNNLPIKVTVIDDNYESNWKGHGGGYDIIGSLNVLSWLSEA